MLVLLIAEAMAVKDAVLSQSPEFKEARIRAYQNATAVYDLLTIATVRWGQVSLLQEVTNRLGTYIIEQFSLYNLSVQLFVIIMSLTNIMTSNSLHNIILSPYVVPKSGK